LVQISAILGLGILCTTIFIYFNYTRSLETFRKNVNKRGEDLAEQLSHPVWNFDKKAIRRLMDVSHRSISHILGIVLEGADGMTSYSTLKCSHTETLETSTRITYDGKRELGTLTMIYSTRSLRLENYKTMAILGAAIVGVIIIICFVNFFILEYRIGESLAQMMSGIRHIIDGDYEHPLPVFRLYELNRFGDALNQTARRISERENDARKLHLELKNLNKELEEANRELENRV
ncbi:MAG: hypothetical protein GY866_41275, partial [Proteobacteria bacterium]|nr:hypothetical protein [Pseudomonadota bacterium]